MPPPSTPKTDYAKYLRSPHWQDVRRRYGESSQPQDCICGETEHLQLHHLTYERLGAEQLEDLTLLCPRCHAMVHVLARRGEMGIDLRGFVSEQRQARYAAERSKPKPDEAWDVVHQDRLTKQGARSRSERVRMMDLALWRRNSPEHGRFVRIIEEVTEAMRQEIKAT